MFSKEPPVPSSVPRQPRQDRSRKTLDRILTALEELLAERRFEEVSMQQIAARAGVSVGTIYTRFPHKEALLPTLFERHDLLVQPLVERLGADLATLATVRERVGRVVDFAVDYHLQRRGLLRALTLHVQSNPGSVAAETVRERGLQYRFVAQAVLGDGDGVSRHDPLSAVEFCLSVVNSWCRQHLLFPEVAVPQDGVARTEVLRAQLSELVLSYLTRPLT